MPGFFCQTLNNIKNKHMQQLGNDGKVCHNIKHNHLLIQPNNRECLKEWKPKRNKPRPMTEGARKRYEAVLAKKANKGGRE